jgi:MFS family permease
MYLPLFVQGVVGISATSSGTVMTPMMFAFMASSIAGGQVLARTGRYKILAHVGFAVAAVGMFLLAQMGSDATRGLVIRNMVILGLGIGAMMSLFTSVVQNAFPRERLGEVTSSLQFFRSIGGTIAVAIFGTVMSNRFAGSLAANVPPTIAQAVPADRLAALNNPQVLLSPEATAAVRQGFTALGPRGQALFDQFMAAIRLSLTDAITGLFAVGCAFMVVGFLVSFLMQEVPLRRAVPAGETAADTPMSGELATDVAEVGELAAQPVGRPAERAA